MTELTAQQMNDIEQSLAQALRETGSEKSLGALVNLPDLFCKNWDTVKRVLQWLAGLPGVPDNLKKLIEQIIKIGDAGHKLCPTNG